LFNSPGKGDVEMGIYTTTVGGKILAETVVEDSPIGKVFPIEIDYKGIILKGRISELRAISCRIDMDHPYPGLYEYASRSIYCVTFAAAKFSLVQDGKPSPRAMDDARFYLVRLFEEGTWFYEHREQALDDYRRYKEVLEKTSSEENEVKKAYSARRSELRRKLKAGLMTNNEHGDIRKKMIKEQVNAGLWFWYKAKTFREELSIHENISDMTIEVLSREENKEKK